MGNSDLYQRVILDHNRNPRNFRELESATHSCDGQNPLCGDEITVYLDLDGDVIADVSFTGSGCAISKAGASLMTGHLKGKTVKQFKAIFNEFQRIVTGEPMGPDSKELLGKLTVLSGVKEYPSRVKCATLAWHTVSCAINEKGETSTQ